MCKGFYKWCPKVPLADCRFADLESLNRFRSIYKLLMNCRPVPTLRFGLQAPVTPCPNGNNFFIYLRVRYMMPFQGQTSLLCINHCLDPAHPELDIEIGYFFIQDASLQLRLDFFVPYRFRVEVQIILKTSSNDCSAREFASKLSWYGKPSLVVEFSFEVVHLWSLGVLMISGFYFSEGSLFWLPTFTH